MNHSSWSSAIEMEDLQFPLEELEELDQMALNSNNNPNNGKEEEMEI